jgi:hypothetical protein
LVRQQTIFLGVTWPITVKIKFDNFEKSRFKN